jgi:hypothetical protein
VVDEKRHVHVTGPMNFVKLGAQMLFYSRASHLRFAWSNATLDATTNTSSTFPTMQPCDITNAQLYGLLQWHYWMRSILNVGTRRTAVTGASLTRSMQEALAILDDDETSDNDNDNVTTITLLVGHDGDLNALATAWGLAWTLDAPYATVPEWYATPPGSALHATRTQLTVTQTATTTANNASKTTVPSSHKATTTAVQDTIEVSYLYPVYSLDESANIDLRQASVSFPASAMVSGINVTLPTTKHLVVQHATFVDYKDWQARVKSMLKLYPGATECYEAAAVEFQSLMATNAKGTTTTPAPNTASTTAPSVTVAATASSSQFWQRSIIALACSNVLLVLILLRQCCRRRDSKQTSPEYNAVSNCSAVHNTYLT